MTTARIDGLKTLATLLCAPLMAAAFFIAPGAWSQALPAEEVPFVVTPDNVTMEMLTIAAVSGRDYVLDLGSGDGRIVITAAKRFGARGMGVEIVPDLVRQSRDNARAAGVEDRAEFRVQDLHDTDLSQATVVTMYLLPEVNLRLRPALLALAPGTRIVSHDWDMGEWLPDKTTVVPIPDKKLGLDKSSKVHLWTVPAKVAGTWCGSGLLRGTRITLYQSFQTFKGEVARGSRVRSLEGRIEGAMLRPSSGSAAQLGLRAEGDVLTVVSAPGNLALLQGASFRRAGAGCD